MEGQVRGAVAKVSFITDAEPVALTAAVLQATAVRFVSQYAVHTITVTSHCNDTDHIRLKGRRRRWRGWLRAPTAQLYSVLDVVQLEPQSS